MILTLKAVVNDGAEKFTLVPSSATRVSCAVSVHECQPGTGSERGTCNSNYGVLHLRNCAMKASSKRPRTAFLKQLPLTALVTRSGRLWVITCLLCRSFVAATPSERAAVVAAKAHACSSAELKRA